MEKEKLQWRIYLFVIGLILVTGVAMGIYHYLAPGKEPISATSVMGNFPIEICEYSW